MKLKLASSIALFFIICFCGTTFSQDKYKMPVVAPHSPDAAGIGKFVEAPVSFYNGLPQISIPIYTINQGSVNVPISISYSSFGHKVEDVSSSIGLGWSLNCGGAISRIVRGKPDELTNGYISGAQYVTKLYTNQFDPVTTANLINDVSKEVIDGQPDIFTLSLPGFSCKFMFDEAGVIQTIPKSKVKIVPGLIGGYGFRSWTVTTTDGVKYELGATDGSDLSGGLERTRSISNYDIVFSESFSNWYLTRIIPLNNLPITFEYDNYTYNYSVNAYQRKHDFLKVIRAPGSSGGSCYGDNILYINTITHFSKKLRRVVFNSGQVEFVPGINREDLPGDFNISQINVQSYAGRTAKKYLMYQSFKSSFPTATGSFGKRMFLDSLRYFDASICEDLTCLTNSQVYRFQYNSQPLPPRNSLSQDYWGYFNGVENGEFLVPAMILTHPFTMELMDLVGADRYPNENFTKAGVLEKVFYPTGGSLELTYEQNEVQAGVPFFKTQQKNYYYSFPVPPPDDDMNGIFNIATCNQKPKKVHFVATGVCTPDPNNINDNKQQWRIYKWSTATSSYSIAVGSLGSLTENNTLDRYYFLEAGSYKVILYKPVTSAPNYNATINIDWKDDVDCYKRPSGGLRIKETKFFDGSNPDGIMKTTYNYSLFNDATKSSGGIPNFPEYHYEVIADAVYVDNVDPYLTQTFIDKCFAFRRSTTPNQTMATTGMGNVGYSNITVSMISGNQPLGKTEYTFEGPLNISDEFINQFPFAPVNSNEWQRGNLIKSVEYKYNSEGGYEKVRSSENIYSTIEQQNFLGIKAGVDDSQLAFTFGVLTDISTPKVQYFNTSTGYKYIFQAKTTSYDQKINARLQENIKNIIMNAANYGISNTSEVNSKGELVTVKYKYTVDYATTTVNGSFANSIKVLQQKNAISLPVEVYTITKDINNAEWVTGGQLIEYNEIGLPLKVYELRLATPLALANFQVSYINASGNVIYDSRYELAATLTYDSKGNVTEQQLPNNITKKYSWGYKEEMPIAECTNCTDGWAYTSFEETQTASWTTSSTNRASGAITGTSSYDLSNGVVTASGFNPAVKYIVSYWSRSGSTLISGASGPLKTGRSVTIGSYTWTLYEQMVTGVSTVSLSGTGIIDELRLIPQSGQILTMTFVPLIGMSEKTDASNKIEYYEYDLFGRLSLVRDQDRNIIKKLKYAYSGENLGDALFPNTIQTGNFVRNNCTSGWVGGSVNYSIPAGTYKSPISVADANVMAQTAIAANGQAYANGGAAACLPTINSVNTSSASFTITLTNTANNTPYSFYIPIGSTTVQIGSLPIGTYNVQISQTGSVSVQLSFNNTTLVSTVFSYSNVNIAAPMTVSVAPAPIPCSFSYSSGYTNVSSSFTSGNGVVSFYMAFYRNTTMTAGNSYFIGTINGGCKPSTTRSWNFSSSGRTWTITIYSTGQMYWYLVPGSPTVNSNSVISCSTQTFNQ